MLRFNIETEANEMDGSINTMLPDALGMKEAREVWNNI